MNNSLKKVSIQISVIVLHFFIVGLFKSECQKGTHITFGYVS